MHFDSGFLWLHPIYKDARDVKCTAPTLNNRESDNDLESTMNPLQCKSKNRTQVVK